MPVWKNYLLPKNIAEALNDFASAPGPVRWIAGGTDLLLDLQQGRQSPAETLVDVTAVAEMQALELRGPGLYIGAGLPLNRLLDSELVRQHAPALFEAAGLIGGPQVRNTATLGGNVAHALPAGDGTISLLALDAQADVAGPNGRRRVPLEQLFLGPGRSALEPACELLVGFYLPQRGTHAGSAFRRVMRPQGVAIAILNMGVWVRCRADVIADIRIAVGPSGPTPRRMRQAEDALRGRALDETSLAAAKGALLAEASFRTSPHRSTAEYRRHMAGVLLQETLLVALERARE